MTSSITRFSEAFGSIDFDRLCKQAMNMANSTLVHKQAESLKEKMIVSLDNSQAILRGGMKMRDSLAKKFESRIAKCFNKVEQTPSDKLFRSMTFMCLDIETILQLCLIDIKSINSINHVPLFYFLKNPKHDPLYYLKEEIDNIADELSLYAGKIVPTGVAANSGNTTTAGIQRQKLLGNRVPLLGNVVTQDKTTVLSNKISQMLVRITNIESGAGKIVKTELLDMQDRLMKLMEGVPNGIEDVIKDALSRVNALLSLESSLNSGIIQNKPTNVSLIFTHEAEKDEDPNRNAVDEYITALLNALRDISSTYGNSSIEKISEGDGSFRRWALAPLLRGMLMLIKDQKVDLYNFSWAEIVQKFDYDSNRRFWQTLRNIASNYSSSGDILRNLTFLLQLIDEFSESEKTSLQVLKHELNKFLIQSPFRYPQNVSVAEKL